MTYAGCKNLKNDALNEIISIRIQQHYELDTSFEIGMTTLVAWLLEAY